MSGLRSLLVLLHHQIFFPDWSPICTFPTQVYHSISSPTIKTPAKGFLPLQELLKVQLVVKPWKCGHFLLTFSSHIHMPERKSDTAASSGSSKKCQEDTTYAASVLYTIKKEAHHPKVMSPENPILLWCEITRFWQRRPCSWNFRLPWF